MSTNLKYQPHNILVDRVVKLNAEVKACKSRIFLLGSEPREQNPPLRIGLKNCASNVTSKVLATKLKKPMMKENLKTKLL